MHMQTIHLSLFAWMCSILMHTQRDMLWMKENLIKGYPKFICKIVFMGIAKTLLNVTGYANVICSKVWESAYQALHRGMIISDCLLLRWPAIRPISIDGIHPSLFVREDYIKWNDLSMTKIEMTRFAPLHTFHKKHQLKWIFIVVYLGVQRPCLRRCTRAWLCLAPCRSIAILVPSTLLSRCCFLDIVLCKRRSFMNLT